MEAWRSFKGEKWKNEIDVKDFILNNYTEYTGDENFLKGISKKTKSLLDNYEKLHKEEMKKGVLDVDLENVSGVNNFKPGYISMEEMLLLVCKRINH